MADLLLELFSEEIPARLQARAAQNLKARITDGLVDRGLTYADAKAFVTPRRLTLAVGGLSDRSPDMREERKGPRVDAPEKALEGFLRSTGLTRDQLERRADKKADVWFAVTDKPGRPAPEIIAETVEEVVRSFPWPKSMRWGAGTLRWVRPLHSILCILTSDAGAEIVPFEIDGIEAGDVTQGHAFAAPSSFGVASFEDYEEKLRAAFVRLDSEDRAQAIAHDAQQLAFAQGLEVVEDDRLLAEVAGLVEWPVTLMGRIEPRFLDLPPEVLRTSMKEHQKFLSLRSPASGQIEGYIVVANQETPDNGATILAGNARVLAARLSDAVFFWENDLKTPLEAMAVKLDAVTFHNKLGSQGERIARVAALAREIAPSVDADAGLAERAARLAKSDLASEMVYEFPELQGVMGRYYALNAGEDPAVADAARDHYAPLGPSDSVPSEPVSVAVALADKVDTLTGFWAIDEKPTGSKDPFALRRAALGVIRILLESGARISLNAPSGPLRKSAELVGSRDAGMADTDDLMRFVNDRLKVHLRDEGLRHDVIDAVYGLDDQDDLVALVARVRALQEFLASDEGANLVAGFRRANSILETEEARDGVEYSLDPIERLAETDSERALFAALDKASAQLSPALEAEEYSSAMAALAELRAPIDDFFESNVVNAPSDIVRRNRLCLLHRVRGVMNSVALFTKIEGG